MAKKRNHRRGGRTTPKGTRPPGAAPRRSAQPWDDDGQLAPVTPLFGAPSRPGRGDRGLDHSAPDLSPDDPDELLDLFTGSMADEVPGQALMVASMMIGGLDPRAVDPTLPRRELVAAVDELVGGMSAVDHPDVVGMALVIAELAASGPVVERARSAAAGFPGLPAWLWDLAAAKVTRTVEQHHDLAAGNTVTVGFEVGDHRLTLVAIVDFEPEPAIIECSVGDLSIEESIEAFMEALGSDPGVHVDELDPADARARLAQAAAGQAPSVPEIDDPIWPDSRAALEWLLATMPSGGSGYPPGYGTGRAHPDSIPEQLLDAVMASMAARVGGLDALAALDDAPLPDEAFVWKGIDDDIVDRVGEVLALGDAVADEHFGVEFRTATRRLLAKIARGGPEVFRRKGAAATAAAAVAWLVARDNHLLNPRAGGLYAKDLHAAFGGSGSSSQRAGAMVRAAGLAPDASAFQCSLDLLVSSGRARLIAERDQILRLAKFMTDEGIGALGSFPRGPWADDPGGGGSGHEQPALRGRTGPKPKPTGTVHRLKVTIVDTKPPVWRRLVVSSDTTLEELHDILQVAFDWWDSHLHQFEVGHQRFGPDDGLFDDFGPPTIDEATVTLADVVGAGDRFTYTYDFGDDWRHRIEVEAVEAPEKGRSYPACTGGRRAGPPEDVGGPWGYQAFVAAIADPDHPDHDDLVGWSGGDFDPADFDPDELDELFRDTH